MGARASPVLIAACHVLRRLSTPRHPSEALLRLIVLSKTHANTGALVCLERPAHVFCICQTMMSSKACPDDPAAGSVKPGRNGPTLRSRCQTLGPARPDGGNSFISTIDRAPPLSPKASQGVLPRRLATEAGPCAARRAKQGGGARRDRTDDLMLAKHALYQLSYGPGLRKAELRKITVRHGDGGPGGDRRSW
jgi:hypothetical protein